jgi:putative redox protein
VTQIDMTYLGDLSTLCVHSESGAEIRTDAPKDNRGLGRAFSPTDLFAASLGSCMLTLMGIAAKSLNIDIKGMRAKVSKEMAMAPVRRIGKVRIDFECPHRYSDEVVAKLIHAAENCPVYNSLHPDIALEFTYTWGN